MVKNHVLIKLLWHANTLLKLAYLQYTSGSTSKPKGVIITHANIMHCLSTMLIGVVEYADSHWFTTGGWTPPYHDFGLVVNILALSVVGNTVIMFSPIDFIKKPLSWIKMLHRSLLF